MKKFFIAVWNFLKSFESEVFPYRISEIAGSFPQCLKRRQIYVLVEDGEPWEARFTCPCGCGDAVDLSLLPNDPPTWLATYDKKKRATLHPSIWRTTGCRSHFFIRAGKVVWV